MPCCEVSDCAQMSKTIIAVRHFELGGRELLETAVKENGKNFFFANYKQDGGQHNIWSKYLSLR